MIRLHQGDCLEVLREKYPDRYFSAASFSPPYGVGSEGFDIRVDFAPGGRFLPYMQEICRVAEVVAVNFTQRVVAGTLSPFTEQMTMALEGEGVTLFDRWVVAKPTAMPRRGERALTNFEFVLLYTRLPHRSIKQREGVTGRYRTVIDVRGRHNKSDVSALGTTPYFPEIPRQVFDLYGSGTVLDPFAGSGTSLLEAEALGIDSVGVELSPDIYESTKGKICAVP